MLGLLRMLTEIEAFEIACEHVPEVNNEIADYISRDRLNDARAMFPTPYASVPNNARSPCTTTRSHVRNSTRSSRPIFLLFASDISLPTAFTPTMTGAPVRHFLQEVFQLATAARTRASSNTVQWHLKV
ncbi:hypothetical protein SARC_05927 [Sphaeroforma arctica JP610]|uniref:Uncharacterized protein n=1 Tax=Sphaeroforma arctica JP610 TaxID=667725 RepID=A0A0L0FYZ1_9EUKA|nr:hypothetical protein SARC_05927 [Sphaeroforma arctica JP610]KNC81781.1 hypothetical protein SARC_05927 [Sphaeroforma arctica JP610]|eukprot:XP_014155683.1 hypothetical protein SARC_05927 [Sphaeroforma arctica JP610]